MACVHDVCTTGDGSDGKSSADAFRGSCQIGHDAEVLRGEVGAGANHATLDLIGDVDDAVVVAPFHQGGEVTLRGDDEATLTLNGFND